VPLRCVEAALRFAENRIWSYLIFSPSPDSRGEKQFISQCGWAGNDFPRRE
jgi:hypothetical protein